LGQAGGSCAVGCGRLSHLAVVPVPRCQTNGEVIMAFLFKSRKSQPTTALPPASRNVHTSEGTSSGTSSAPLNGIRERDGGGVISPTPSGSVNNSLNSLSGTNSPDPIRTRQRADSESLVSLQACRDWPKTENGRKRKEKKAYPTSSGSSVSWSPTLSVERMLILGEGPTISTSVEWSSQPQR
jgi:hypothetical protein